MAVVTWRKKFEAVLDGDTLIHNTLTEEDMDVQFDDGYGGPEGKPFTAWSETHVYFPQCYDGAEWIERVPRNPNNEPTQHMGGY